MVSPLFLVQIWCSRRRSRRLSVLWATLEDGDGSSLLSPPLVWSLSLIALGSFFWALILPRKLSVDRAATLSLKAQMEMA
ncbi:hypothetical protein YC2023_065575 [Brassica napus]